MNDNSVFKTFEVQILTWFEEWWIPMTVLLSLLMQLLLLLTGGTRKRSSLLRAIAWGSYNVADYLASLALGGMAQGAIGSHKTVYAIWAPILLLHMGAPDNITAYAVEDAELWLRHGLFMIFQVITAVFVVSNCVEGMYISVLSSCLMLAGSIKYGERILAIRYASKSGLAESALPFYRYMYVEPCLNLPIKGLNIHDQLVDNADSNHTSIDNSVNSDTDQTYINYCVSSDLDHSGHIINNHQPNSNLDQTADESSSNSDSRFFYIIAGEMEWYHKVADSEINLSIYRKAAIQTPELVTLHDIFSCRDAEALLKTGQVLHLCLGFALFKLYLRRLSRLHMYKWRKTKTRRLFLDYAGDSSSTNFFARLQKQSKFVPEANVLFVLDVELRFLYDRIYSKAAGTAFTRTGVLFRIFTTLLLIVSTIVVSPVMNRDQHISSRIEQHLTFVLVVFALLIEVYQLARLLLSDWTKVWLATKHIQLLEQQRKENPKRHRAMQISMNLYSWLVRKALLSGISLGQNYWRNRIGQYSLLDSSCFKSTEYSIASNLIHKFFRKRVTKYENNHKLLDNFRCRAIKDLLGLCERLMGQNNDNIAAYSQMFSVKYLVQSVGRPWRTPFLQYCVYVAAGRNLKFTDSETLMVNWHLATIVCDLLDGSVADQIMNIQQEHNEFLEEMKMAKLLSSYSIYLLVHKTELLPCHPDIGRHVAENTEKSLHSALKTIYSILNTQNEENNADYLNNERLLLQNLALEAREISVETLMNDFSWQKPDDSEEIRTILERIKKNESEYHHRTGRGPPNEELSIPRNIMNGIITGKLLMFGIPDRNQRWGFIWDIWIEILACLASANRVEMHLQQLTLGGEFLTQIWVLLGHMGFGNRS